jgi:hypothetical protein
MTTGTFNIINPTTNAVLGTLADGGTWYQSLGPATLQFVPSANIAGVTFLLDQLPAVVQQAPPYIVNNKHPQMALNLSTGSHVLRWQINGEAQQTLNFTVALSPVPPVPTYYVSTNGNDANAGTLAAPWKTPKAVNGATVILLPGVYVGMVNFSGMTGATVASSDAANPSTLQAPAGGGNVTSWSDTTIGCTFGPMIVDSVDGKGNAGNVRGKNNSVIGVILNDINEGFDWNACTNPTIKGGYQTGTVQGRCHFLIGCTNITWVGDPTHSFGPSIAQSPIRFSTFQNSNGTFSPNVGGAITGVRVTQVGSAFAIACWAIHAARNIQFINCVANGGQFSFNTAGAAEGDVVDGCLVQGLTVLGAELAMSPVATNNQVSGGSFNVSGSECVALTCTGNCGNTITGATMYSDKAGVHLYNTSNVVVSQSTLYTPTAGASMLIGSIVPANDGGGNKVIVV